MMKWSRQRTEGFKDSEVQGFGKGRLILLIMAFAGLVYGVFPLPERDMTAAAERALPMREALTDSVDLQLPFAIDSLCRVSDPAHSLDVFLKSLDLLLAGEDTVIKIVHLGDSHVQAGFYSGQVMRMLQGAFGNAGRGWIAPLKLAKVNEPKDYRITSSLVKEWAVGRCIQKTPGCRWGLGGMGLQPHSKAVDFAIGVTPVGGAGYAFNKLLLYRDGNAMPLWPVEADTAWVQTVCGTGSCLSDVVVDTFRMAFTVDSLHLYSSVGPDAEAAAGDGAGSYYGFSLMNGKPGILYHAIGQNGARFVNYTDGEYVRQLSLLEPSLLIITLGTNETFSIRNFRAAEFVSQVDDFVRLVRKYLPATAILLTTPAESFRRTRNGYVRNENISRAAAAIREYAEANGVACFDLYHVTGGPESCRQWQKAKLLGYDRVHFTVAGYQEQAKLLYKALIRLKINQQNLAPDESV